MRVRRDREAWDEEMRARIETHRADAAGGWRTVEAPLADRRDRWPRLPRGARVVLLDCMTLLVSNAVLRGG